MTKVQKSTLRIMNGVRYAIDSTGRVSAGALLISIVINYFRTEREDVIKVIDREFKDAGMVGIGGLIASMKEISLGWGTDDDEKTQEKQGDIK